MPNPARCNPCHAGWFSIHYHIHVKMSRILQSGQHCTSFPSLGSKMAEANTATDADPPIPKPEEAVGSDTLQPTQNPDPKPEVTEEQKPSMGSQTKKRKLDHVDEIRNSTYFKIRSIIKDLRLFFIEVIHAPDFRESKAANDIRKQMKTMIELTRQLRNEPFPTKSKEEHPKEQPLMGAIKEEKKENRENQMPQSQNGELPYSSDNAQQPKESAMPLGERLKGTYVIGGSPVGLNFMVYPGSCPIYYGVTKASFRTRHIAS